MRDRAPCSTSARAGSGRCLLLRAAPGLGKSTPRDERGRPRARGVDDRAARPRQRPGTRLHVRRRPPALRATARRGRRGARPPDGRARGAVRAALRGRAGGRGAAPARRERVPALPRAALARGECVRRLRRSCGRSTTPTGRIRPRCGSCCTSSSAWTSCRSPRWSPRARPGRTRRRSSSRRIARHQHARSQSLDPAQRRSRGGARARRARRRRRRRAVRRVRGRDRRQSVLPARAASRRSRARGAVRCGRSAGARARTRRRPPCSAGSRRSRSPAPALASAAAVLGDGAPLERAAASSRGSTSTRPRPRPTRWPGRRSWSTGRRLSFVHPIVREAVYAGDPRGAPRRAPTRARPSCSRRAARTRSSSRRTWSRRTAPRASGPCRRCARPPRLARERGAPAAAARYLREALATLTRESDRGGAADRARAGGGKGGHEQGAGKRATEAIDAPRRRRASARRPRSRSGMALVDGASRKPRRSSAAGSTSWATTRPATSWR